MKNRHRFHGDPERFEVLADYVADNFRGLRHVADVAGGQGMLSRLLNKKGFSSEVIDPRGWPLKGIKNRAEEYSSGMADYYDLVVGLHPDQALEEVVQSAVLRPVIVIPCCNFWDTSRKLGRNALLEEIGQFFTANNITFEKITFSFKGPQNIGLVTK
jgi:hypothetical protein